MNASSIEIGSTCGVSSSISVRTCAADRRRTSSMFGRTHDRVRAEPARLEHRHRRAHAEGARDVAGGGHHAALAAADDQRLVGERRVVALLDRCVERVAIDMRDGERLQFGVAQDARRAAGRAARGVARRRARQSRQKRRHHGTSRSQSRRAPHARAISAGSTRARVRTPSAGLVTRNGRARRRNPDRARSRMRSGPMPVVARKRPSCFGGEIASAAIASAAASRGLRPAAMSAVERAEESSP